MRSKFDTDLWIGMGHAAVVGVALGQRVAPPTTIRTLLQNMNTVPEIVSPRRGKFDYLVCLNAAIVGERDA